MRIKRVKPEVRFWNMVDKEGPVCAAIGDKCWIWLGGKIRGYGHFWLDGKTVKAYRYSYELHKGNFDKSLSVCHHCDNPSCVNPNHLFVGTTLDNQRDKVKKGRQAKGATHGFVKDNNRLAPRGEKHGNAALTDDLVNSIRIMYKKGSKKYGTYGLAELFNVAQVTIWRIVTDQSWKHL